ncbi:MAG: hypothetical protein L6R41_007370 [Letrouitia leprolyta]|nr:MAG: hypothetical protein L6R41_007370 [Letrouitia leprolyta]
MEKVKFDSKTPVNEVEVEIESIQWTSSWDSIEKPLPSTPKVPRLQTCLEYLIGALRSLGLNLLVYVLQRFFGYGLNEIPKKAFHRDRTMALLRVMIHLLPLFVAMGELVINWQGHYIGANINGLSYLQFAAKMHEMAMQSSLAIIVFAYLRHVLFKGDALPIGAMLSGLQLTQPSYLWSMELWGIPFSNIPFRRKLSVMTTIIIALLLASTVGPSSAILMIPNLGYWPAGSTHIWMNVTAEALWPSSLDGSSVPTYCSQAPNVSNICPSSEWKAISDYLSLANGILPSAFRGPFSVSPYSVQLTGQGSLRQLVIQRHIYENQSIPYGQAAAQATTQQAVVADALSATSSLWDVAMENSNSLFFDQRDAVQSIVADNYQPYTLASCGADIIQDKADERPVAFPIPPGSSLDMLNEADITNTALPMLAITHPRLTRKEILDTPGPKSDYRVKWVDLPEDPFNGSAIGAVILQPTTNSSQGILLCNVAAGWGSSSMNMSSSPAASGTDWASSSIYDSTGTLPQAEDYSQRIAESVLTFKLPLFPQRPINISTSWAEYLNPQIPTLNTTVFNTLMARKLDRKPDSTSANIILAGLVANGLSRTAFEARLQGTVRTVFHKGLNATIPDSDYWFSNKGDIFTLDPTPDTKNFLKLRVDSAVEGYAFSMDGLAPKITAAVLLLYCALVVAHVLYAAVSGISSTSWDTITEWVLLAVNSPTSVRLRNTCAGVHQMGIFGRRILEGGSGKMMRGEGRARMIIWDFVLGMLMRRL